MSEPDKAAETKKRLYVVLTQPAEGWDLAAEDIEPHIKFLKGLEEKGVLFCAGAFLAENEEEPAGGGLIIIRAGSLAEAREIVTGDPFYQIGARTYTVRPWRLSEGILTIRAHFSSII